MTTPYLVTTTHTPTLMCGCPACVAAYLASLAASDNKAAYDAAVKTIGTGSLLAVAAPLAVPPAPSVADVAAGSPVLVQVPVVPAITSTASIPQPVGSFNPATLGTSVGTLSFSASGGQYANASYLGPYDAFSEIDYTTAATTPQTYYAAVTLNAGANYIFDLATYSYGYLSGNQNFGVSLELFNSSGVQQTTTASNTGNGGIAIKASTSGTYYVEVIATGNATNYWSTFDLRSAVSTPLPAATYTSIMPDGLSNATYVQALLAGGGSWWHVAGGGITPTATDGLSGALHSITYSFLTSDYSGDTTGGFAAMGANEQTAVKAALAYISSLFDITFTQVAAGTGMINYGTNDQGSTSAGYAFYANTPGGANVMISNDATYGYTNSSSYAIGTYAWETLLHETGHALGLKHPGNYNAGGGGTIAPYLPTDMDSREYSIMSYNDPSNITYTSDGTGGSYYFETLNPTSYQLIDFYALQYLYGANTTTTTLVNQTFSWALNASIMETIYAYGSNNIIDLSNQTLPSIINLNDGTFSSIDERLNATDLNASLSPNLISYGGYSYLASANPSEAAQLYNGVNDLAIAPNAEIDILKLGGGADTVTGNNDGDTIYLGSGTDTVTGGSSNDVFHLGTGSATINGGGGNNTVYASVTRASATISYSNGTTTLTIGGATDTLTNIASVVFTDGTYTPGYQIPSITDPNATLTGLDTSVAAGSLFSVVDNNGVATSALIYTLTDTGSAGHFYINGVMQANGTPFTVNATQLAQTTYVATIRGGTDTISMSVNDGIGATSAQFTVTSPGLTVAGVTLTQSLHAQTYAVTSLYTSAVDGAGSIASYTFDDTNNSATAGYFVLNGVQQANLTPITVTAAQLSTLTYVSPQFGTDTITVMITDGSGLSSTPATTTVTGPSVVAPTLTVQSTTLAHGVGSSVSLSSLISATDNNGISLSQLTYTLSDAGSAGGFVYNGTNYGHSATFTASQLSQATYVSTAASGTDTISVSVSDGLSSSATKTFTITNQAPTAPVVTVAGVTTATSGATYASFANVISTADSNGVSASGITYTLSYTGTGGVLYLDGNAEATGTNFTVSGTDLTGLSYIPGVAGGTATVTVTANDTYATSASKTFTITSPNTPGPVITAVPTNGTLTTGLGGANFSLSQLFTYADANPNATVLEYQFEFSAGTGSVGGFSVAGVAEQNATAIDVNPGELGLLSYNITSGTQNLYMRGNDGTGTDNASTAHWGAWTKVIVTVPVAKPPVLTANSVTLNSVTNSFATAAAITATDSNGVGQSILTYSLTYTGSGGTLYLGSTAETEGSAITLTGSQLSALSYSPSLFGGSDTFTVTVSDGYATSAPVTFTVTSPNTPGPVVTAISANVTTGLGGLQGEVLSLLYNATVTDAFPGAVISDYEFDDVAGTGSVGNWTVGSTVEPNGTVFDVSPSNLNSVAYNISSGTQTLYMRADDGLGTGTASNAHWGAWTKVVVTVPVATPPVLTANSITLSSATSSFATAAAITATDSNGVGQSILTYSLTYTGSGGTLYLGSTAEAEGSAITLRGTQLSALSYSPSLFGGSDTFTVTVSDGYATSAPVTFTVTSPNTPGPVVTAVSANVTTGLGGLQGEALSLLYSSTVTDAFPGAVISDYEFDDVAGTGSVGNWTVGPTVEANGTVFDVSPSNLSSVAYNISSGTQTLYMRADDGPGTGTAANAHWGAWVKVTVTVPAATPPRLSANSITLNSATSSFATAAAITASDSNGVSLSSLTYTLTYTGSGGMLYLGSTAEVEGTAITLTASQLSALSYSPSLSGGIDTVTLKATDTYATSALVNFTVTSANTPGPVFTANAATLQPVRDHIYQTPAQLFTENDAYPGAVISQYEFFDNDTAGGTGSFLLSGVAQQNDIGIFVTAANLSSISYQSVSGTQTIYIRANDGTVAVPHWGAWSAITVTAPAVTVAAVFTPTNANITSLRDAIVTAPLSLYSKTDLSGGTVAQYQFYDNDMAGGLGSFLLNGVAQKNDLPITVAAGDISTISYQAIAGAQTISVRANDGTLAAPVWGAWSSITVTAPAVTVAAVFTPTNPSITSLRDAIVTAPLSLYSKTDLSGGTIAQYQFYDNDTAGLGSFLLNGVAQKNDLPITVAAGDISTISYQAIAGAQTISVRANDGTLAAPVWGAWSSITVTAPAVTQAAVFTPLSATVTTTAGGQTYTSPLSLYHAVSDSSGGTIAQYQFIDTGSLPGTSSSGSFLVSGLAQLNNQVITVAAANLSTVSYKIQSGAQSIYVRANDGTLSSPVWGAWSEVTLTVPTIPGVGAPVASAPVINIPNLSSALVSSPAVAVSSVVSPASLLTPASLQPSSLFAVHHA